MQLLRRITERAIDIVYPEFCRLCSTPIAERLPYCVDCRESLDRQREVAYCPRCGSSVAPFEVSDGRCRRCRRRKLRTAQTARVAEYADSFSLLLRRYKYGDTMEFEGDLVEWLGNEVYRCSWFPSVEAVTAVPTHWKRRWGRPFHAAEAIATALAGRLELPFVRLLHRKRSGPHQIGLSYTERVRNVRGAFQLRQGVQLAGANIILVDDVRTTGATLNECARVLRADGAATVYAAVLAAVGWDKDRRERITFI